MDRDELLDELPDLVRARAKDKTGKKAVYKYVVLLWAIGRVARGQERLAAFSSSRSELQQLLSPFRLGTVPPKPADPWWA